MTKRPRLQTLKPRLQTVPGRLSKVTVPTYGQGRGGRPWRRLVEQVKLRDQYTCRLCSCVTEQGECDHVVPRAQGGTDDLSNLAWTCIPCHAEKTRRDAQLAHGHRPKARISVDGWPELD